MNTVLTGFIPFFVVISALAATYLPLGNYLGRVFTSEHHFPLERLFYRAIGIRPDAKQHWSKYATSVLSFSAISILFVYLLQRTQQWLPLNHGKDPVSWDQAWNTAVSFTTNTNWQSYSGETTMTILTQMMGLAVQNFLSAAVGISVAIALVRGLSNRKGDGDIGNFWVDLTRTVLRVLLPLAVLGALVLISQGVIQNFSAPQTIQTITGGTQTLPGGALASQEVIKELGTNGGGYFNANSAHPFENPNAWTNMLEIFLILVIPVALTRAFGVIVGDKRQGWAILSTMATLYFLSLTLVTTIESALQNCPGGGMEGKELRFGIIPSSLFAVSTTMTSSGAVDSFHSSYSPLSGAVLMVNMLLGEISPGGVGSGLYGMLVIAILTVFIAGLMVGRTPEYLGKHIGVKEITTVCLFLLVMPMLVLAGVGISSMLPSTLNSVSTQGPHAFSEIIYAYTSAANNNGSAFAGFHSHTPWFNMSLGFAMLFGRFIPIVMVLALAGGFANQKPAAHTSGTLPTHRPLFVGLTVAIALIVSALTFLPALALGPLTEALS